MMIYKVMIYIFQVKNTMKSKIRWWKYMEENKKRKLNNLMIIIHFKLKNKMMK